MPNNEVKNVVATLPYDTYLKLRYIADTMHITMPQLMGQILNNDFFLQAVDSMFQMITKCGEEKNK